MAQELVGFTVAHEVRASAEAVWAVLGDFGTEHRWTRTLVHCSRDTRDVAVGSRRKCVLPKPLMGRTEVSETLSEFEPGVALAYDLEGPAGPFASASSRWSTQTGSDGSSTIVCVEGRFQPRNWLARFVLWPIAKPMVRRLTRRVLCELDAFVTVPGINDARLPRRCD
jgi:hypothetical protein